MRWCQEIMRAIDQDRRAMIAEAAKPRGTIARRSRQAIVQSRYCFSDLILRRVGGRNGDRRLVRRRRLEGRELTGEKPRRHEMAGAAAQALADQIFIAID